MIVSQAFILIIFVMKIGTRIYICNVYSFFVIIISIFLNLARMLRSKDTPEGCSPRMYQSVALSVLRYVTLGSQVCLLCTHSLSYQVNIPQVLVYFLQVCIPQFLGKSSFCSKVCFSVISVIKVFLLFVLGFVFCRFIFSQNHIVLVSL